jgi:hypothetical protein
LPSEERDQEPAQPRGPTGSETPSFTAEERRLLVKACQAYRRGIPIYLQSAEAERRLVDELIKRLAP